MKKILFILITLATTLVSNAQTSGVQPILTSYLQLKDALVKSDAVVAAGKAAQLLGNINQVAVASLSKNELVVFSSEKESFVKSITAISKTTAIEKQRGSFAALSVSLWKLVQAADSVSGNVYYQYCPMKKSFWLSTEAAIKNPYYGSAMLTCGNVADKKNQ